MENWKNGQLIGTEPLPKPETEHHPVPPTIEEQIIALQNALISQKISGGGIKVTDSSGLPLEEFTMSGKTEQVQTTGAQLFDISLVNETNSIEVKNNDIIAKEYANNIEITPEMFLRMTGLKLGDKCRISYVVEGKVAGSTGGIAFLGAKAINVSNGGLTGKIENTFTIPQDFTETNYGTMYLYGNNAGEPTIFKNLMINVGESTKPYEPYTDRLPSPRPDFQQPIKVTPQGIITVDFTDGTNHQTIELNCPREFTKWDKLEKTDGMWNWVFGSKKETFENTVVINMIDVSSKNTKQFTISHSESIKDDWSYACVLSNTFVGVKGSDSYTQSAMYDFYVSHHNREIIFSSKKLDGIFETKETFQEWLRSSGTYILRKSDEKELIPLSQSEQNKLNALTMYATNTEITNDSDCNMELTYTVDTKFYVDSKILSLSKALL